MSPSSGPRKVWDCEMDGDLLSRSPRLSGVWAPGPVSLRLRQAECRPHPASDADHTNSGTGNVGPQPQHNCTVIALETKHIVVFCVSWVCLIAYKTLDSFITLCSLVLWLIMGWWWTQWPRRRFDAVVHLYGSASGFSKRTNHSPCGCARQALAVD